MARFTRQQIDEMICARFKQNSENCVEGPFRLADYDVWRVWTQDEAGNYHAHYAAAAEKGDPILLEDFSPFANWLHREFDLDGQTARDLGVLPILVASLVVLVGMALVVFVVVKNPQEAFPLAAMLTAIVGGGAGFLFAKQRSGSRN